MPSVFISYASEDRSVARVLQEALPAYGLEVWYDESELGGGEAWDHKIRRQIRECDYFMPLISRQTERRAEGYFRREWRVAVERTLDMADDHLFLLPIVIDETNQALARVPEKFLTVQWLKVPGGVPTPALEALCRRIAAGGLPEPQRASGASAAVRTQPTLSRQASTLPFPVEENGEKVRFWFEVVGWLFRSAWLRFQSLSRWLRVAVYIWLGILLMSRCTTSPHRAQSDAVSPAKLEKLKTIADAYQGRRDKQDVAKLGDAVAREFAADDEDPPTAGEPLIAFAFTAPAGNDAAAKLADSAFAMAYGRLAISHKGQVGLASEPPSSHELSAAVAAGKAAHASHVLWGDIEKVDGALLLAVKIAKVADSSVVWGKSYDVAGADPARIAADIEAHMPHLETP